MKRPAGDSELIQIVDAALAEAARRAGNWLACKPGCAVCCYGAFAIGALDAARLAEGMETLRTTDAARADRIEARAREWVAEHRAAFPGDAESGLLGESDEEQQRFEEFANEAACPALDPSTGCCDLYDARPMTCRAFGPPVRMGAGEALGCCELCFKNASPEEIANCEMELPHALEARLLDAMKARGNTVVAFTLLH